MNVTTAKIMDKFFTYVPLSGTLADLGGVALQISIAPDYKIGRARETARILMTHDRQRTISETLDIPKSEAVFLAKYERNSGQQLTQEITIGVRKIGGSKKNNDLRTKALRISVPSIKGLANLQRIEVSYLPETMSKYGEYIGSGTVDDLADSFYEKVLKQRIEDATKNTKGFMKGSQYKKEWILRNIRKPFYDSIVWWSK